MGAERSGVEVTGELVEGGPATGLLEVVRDGDLLVVGSRGRGALAANVFGSTVNSVLGSVCRAGRRRTWCQGRALTVMAGSTGSAPLEGRLTTILVGIDGSTDSDRAAAFAAKLAVQLGADVVAAHAVGLLDVMPEPTDAWPPERSARTCRRLDEWSLDGGNSRSGC